MVLYSVYKILYHVRYLDVGKVVPGRLVGMPVILETGVRTASVALLLTLRLSVVRIATLVKMKKRLKKLLHQAGFGVFCA